MVTHIGAHRRANRQIIPFLFAAMLAPSLDLRTLNLNGTPWHRANSGYHAVIGGGGYRQIMGLGTSIPMVIRRPDRGRLVHARVTEGSYIDILGGWIGDVNDQALSPGGRVHQVPGFNVKPIIRVQTSDSLGQGDAVISRRTDMII